MPTIKELPATRICRGPCGRELPIESFRKHTATGPAREYDCHDCHRQAMNEWREMRRRKVVRRFCKVGQFQKLDRRLRSVGASVMRRLGGPDRVAQLWAQATKEAMRAGRDDRFLSNSMNLFFRLQLFAAEQEVKGREERERAERAGYAAMTDEQVSQHMLKQIEKFIRENPTIAVEIAGSIGWTVIPPTAANAG